ncbi:MULTISPECIES: nitrogen fixation protein NifH [unclassified Dehalobacter]|uniref:nitrogen fixation protein NifH n=1 Tax=unclassified Dehalobacter TaxID=2635733 RepID=UPI000E6BA97C|nr:MULTISPECIES: nitrogen fixation protein NifH [unclassified Dehalobacter]RJE48899.1 nitrogen fixation protein NifH [Dehalobacter sp. MCB1]TCX52062.1 nitrogen fixation protein NifH [Dehalobacter sp. 14DCB1]TCX53135.1 nitrogen fixation protein NifH [Dehalobacter sp. 12DCB1]
MRDWKSKLKADPINWLLEDENPSVRYFTLKDILDKPEHDPEVQQVKHNIMQSSIVPYILGKQQEAEYLKTYSKFYLDKYKGLAWQLIVLAEMGAEANSQIIEQCEYILNNSQEAEDGGFAMNMAAKKGGGRISEVLPCLTGNMVWSLIHFGYLDDPRLQKAIYWITRFMRFNDGVEDNPQSPPYDRLEICWGKHTCFMGIVKALRGLSAIPQEKRTSKINDTINKSVEFLLIHHIYKRSHNLSKTSKPGWLKFSFPLMYQTDVLEILDILTELGIADDRMNDALNIILTRQDDMGRWRIENTSNTDRLLIPLEQKGEQSKWITLRAIRVLKRYKRG